MELRERVIAVLRTTELWRDMDGIGTLDTYGPADSDYAKLADAAIAAVLDALQEPSAEMVLSGMTARIDHPAHDNTLSRHERLTAGIYKAMLTAFRTEALGDG